ncbi:MAG: hypothetical protein ROZ00_07940 [Denitratisoma sp.]|nr:hypothetical protein [Denitratisoma sp.]
MKIANASLQMESGHAEISHRQVRESLRTWVGPQRPDFEGGNSPSALVDVSAAARASQSAEAEAVEDMEGAAEGRPELQLIKSMIEMLTGRRIRVVSAADIRGGAEAPDVQDPKQPPARGNAGWGVEYDYREIRDEAEHTAFSAQGTVRTADGREIRFDLKLAMERVWHEESSISLRAGDARRKDPLVLNFDGKAAELSSTRFRFDLDANGTAEDVPLLGRGSGYLALDLNGDGKITSGAELFGPLSGDGYADLAKYDADGNRWIDENDAVFDRLRIWSPAAGTGGTMATLRQRNVGALSLDRLSTPFDLRSPGNDSLGAVRSSGVYLTENGQAGTTQQIDLTV